MAIYYAGSAKRRAEVVGKPAAGWELSRKVDPKAKTSSKRAEANRRNAQKSTGPRTAEGKDRSNAVAHGLTARSELRPGEDPRELLERRRSLLDDLKPRNQLEALQIERIATDVDVITPLKAIAEADAAEAPLRMAFELGPEGEAHRRYVLANERLVNRTIGEFLKIRKMSEAGFLDGDSSIVRGSSPLVDCQGDAIEVP